GGMGQESRRIGRRTGTAPKTRGGYSWLCATGRDAAGTRFQPAGRREFRCPRGGTRRPQQQEMVLLRSTCGRIPSDDLNRDLSWGGTSDPDIRDFGGRRARRRANDRAASPRQQYQELL